MIGSSLSLFAPSYPGVCNWNQLYKDTRELAVINIRVTGEQKRFAQALVKKHNFGNRGIADGNAEEQYVGILGQTVFADALHLARPTGTSGFDGGVDFLLNDKRVDVKTMGRNYPMKNHYVHNFIGFQKDYQVDYYIFCSFNKRSEILTLCGYVSKTEFFEKSIFYKKGTVRYRDDGTSFKTKTDHYEIEQRNLNSLHRIKDITTQIT